MGDRGEGPRAARRRQVEKAVLVEPAAAVEWVQEVEHALSAAQERRSLALGTVAWLLPQAEAAGVLGVSNEPETAAAVAAGTRAAGRGRRRRRGRPAYMTSGASRWRVVVTASSSTRANPPAAPARPEPDWEDLAGRRPGGTAREQADAQPSRAGPHLPRSCAGRANRRAGLAHRRRRRGRSLVSWASWPARTREATPECRPGGRNGSDNDHVVIGPGGVFSLNAKHHAGGKVWVGGNTLIANGQRQPYLRNCAFAPSWSIPRRPRCARRVQAAAGALAAGPARGADRRRRRGRPRRGPALHNLSLVDGSPSRSGADREAPAYGRLWDRAS